MSKGHRNQWKEFPMAEDRTILVKQINKVVLIIANVKVNNQKPSLII